MLNKFSKIKLFILLSSVYCLVTVTVVQAQVQVAAVVPSLVDVQKSKISVEKDNLIVKLYDKDWQALVGKVVEAGEEEVRTGENGKAVFQIKNVKLKSQNNNVKLKIDSIVVDRINYLGTYGYLEKINWISKLFNKVQAQEKGLTLTPATVSLQLPAGETTTQTITVTNTTGKDGSFEAYLSDYWAIDETASVFEFLSAGTQADSLKTILEINPVRFDLKNNESKEIVLRVAPQEGVNSGKYKGAVFVSSIVDAGGEGTRLSVASKVGTLVGVDVEGKATQSKQGLELTADSNRVYYEIAIFAIIVGGIAIFFFWNKKKKK